MFTLGYTALKIFIFTYVVEDIFLSNTPFEFCGVLFSFLRYAPYELCKAKYVTYVKVFSTFQTQVGLYFPEVELPRGGGGGTHGVHACTFCKTEQSLQIHIFFSKHISS